MGQIVKRSIEDVLGSIEVDAPPYDTICSAHWKIQKLADQIAELSEEVKGSGLRSKILVRAQKINEVAKIAEDMGQRMENRLYDVNDSIISAGYKRDKKNPTRRGRGF